MTTARTPPTDTELRDAYARAGLDRLGITYAQAIATPSLRGSLHGMVNSDRRWAANTLRHGSIHIQRTQGDKP